MQYITQVELHLLDTITHTIHTLLSLQPQRIMTMELQVASDLHLEFYDRDFQLFKRLERDSPEGVFWQSLDILVAVAPTIALLGDISVCTHLKGRQILESFLTWLCPQFVTVLFVAGNHEYYNSAANKAGPFPDVDSVNVYLDSLSAVFPNFHFLHKRRVEIEGVIFLGTELWSLVPTHDPAIAHEVEGHLNDYKVIQIMDRDTQKLRVLTVADTNAFFTEQRSWLETSLRDIQSASPSQPVVVLSHHGPTWTGCSNPQYERQAIPAVYQSHGFVTDLLPLIESATPHLQAWFYGHTHYNNDRTVADGVLLSSNQRGYPTSICQTYDIAKKFVIQSGHGKRRRQDTASDDRQMDDDESQSRVVDIELIG
jgi:hypothetical protein